MPFDAVPQSVGAKKFSKKEELEQVCINCRVPSDVELVYAGELNQVIESSNLQFSIYLDYL